MNNLKFATCINCMDGRTQEPVYKFLKKKASVDYVDMITEPGPDKILSQNRNKQIISSIKKRVKISVKKHKSNLIAIVGHYDCAGNPVNANKHLAQIKTAARNIHKWKFNVPILGVWVDEGFEVKENILIK